MISQRAAGSVRGEKSRMKREFHVRFCEGAGVQFPCATRRVSRTQARRVCGAVWKMKDRPFEVGFREQASNHPKRHRSKAVVVSVGGKGRRYRSGVDHGDERERTTDDVSKHFLATSKPGAGPSPGTRLGGAR